MFSQPEHHHNLSLRLSQVLDDIGVNKTMILKRRRTWMLSETLTTIGYLLTEKFREKSVYMYNFGSQTEGSTTQGLHSDLDGLQYDYRFRIIQDLPEWEYLPDTQQYMMVQDETTSPGYCLLQLMRPDVPLPAQDIPDEYHTKDDKRRMLLRHSLNAEHIEMNGAVRHGPAAELHREPEEIDIDHVTAFHCSSWPKEADPWLHQQNVSGWPSEEMKKYSAEQGCFVIPVSSRTCVEEYQDLEWRISTSLAERCLMFNINITQMRCYILMKMILKTFLKPKCGDAISSFMCKNILFHCIAESDNSSTWNESTLLTWLSKCLQSLLNSIQTDNCPHFMIPGNNLLAGKLSADVKHQIVDVMYSLTENIGQSLLSIQIDDPGNRLYVKSGGILHDHLQTAYEISKNVTLGNNGNLAHLLLGIYTDIHKNFSRNSASAYQELIDSVVKLCHVYSTGNTLQQVAVSFLTPFFCSRIGCVIASEDIQRDQVVCAKALILFTLGLNSDLSSGKLKMASALYCAGDLEKCEVILNALGIRLTQTLIRYCAKYKIIEEVRIQQKIIWAFCCCFKSRRYFPDSEIASYEKNFEDFIKHNIACCAFICLVKLTVFLKSLSLKCLDQQQTTNHTDVEMISGWTGQWLTLCHTCAF